MIGTFDTEVDGKRVHVRIAGETGDGETPPVVFVHSTGTDGSIWDSQVEGVTTGGLRAMAVDLPGHGGSAGPALHTIDGLAAWTARFLDAVDAPRAHLVGASMGALVVLELAALDPGRVASLALLGVAATMSVNPDLNPWQVKEILESTARDLPPEGRDSGTGAGLVDAHAAVLSAMGK